MVGRYRRQKPVFGRGRKVEAWYRKVPARLDKNQQEAGISLCSELKIGSANHGQPMLSLP